MTRSPVVSQSKLFRVAHPAFPISHLPRPASPFFCPHFFAGVFLPAILLAAWFWLCLMRVSDFRLFAFPASYAGLQSPIANRKSQIS